MLRHAASPDGTRIAYEVGGSGPPLVCVHGAGSARWSFDLVRPPLEDTFTVVAIDRRARGDSTDGGAYAIERECEDVEAVLREVGPDARLLGHSYGGLVSAAVLARKVVEPVRAALYEPPRGGVLASASAIDAWEDRLAEGDRSGALEAFLTDVGGYSAAQIEEMRATPAWAQRIAVTPTVPRELRAELAYEPDLEAFAEVRTPTLMLVGSDSPPWAVDSTRLYAATIPNAEVRTLDGQGHGALVAAPELVARKLRDFLG